MKHPGYFIWIVTLLLVSGLLTNCYKGSEQPERDEMGTLEEEAEDIRQERDTTNDASVYKANLETSTEDPAEEPESNGTVYVTIDGDSIHIQGDFVGLSSPYESSYIHMVLESDRVQELEPTLNEDKTAGSWEASYQLDKDQISALEEDSLYISVYTREDESGEGGAISGQLRSYDEDL